MKKIVIEFKLDDDTFEEVNKMVKGDFDLQFTDWIKYELQSNMEYELDMNVSGSVSVQVKDVK